MQNGMQQNQLRKRLRPGRQIISARFVLGLTLIAGAGLAADEGSARRIYRCDLNGQTTFTDRPCPHAPSSEVQLSPLNSYQAEATITPRSRKPATSAHSESTVKHAASIAAEQQKKQQQCRRLADQLDSIRSKMRSGYTAEQGEKMRVRQRQLERQRRTERCG